MSEFVIKSINVSEKKGVAKTPVGVAYIAKNLGIRGDAHRGMKNRQISLLSREEIDAFKPDLADGSFGENFTTLGLDTDRVRLLDRIRIGNTLMEVSKIGKTCHDRCHIYHTMGDCIMPKKGFFVRVIKGSQIISKETQAQYLPKTFRVGIITLSDRAARGEYHDRSGDIAARMLEEHFTRQGRLYHIDRYLMPDSRRHLFWTLARLLLKKYDLILTTGGTGISSRDITVGVVRALVQKKLPGIMDFIRNKYGTINPKALISRSIAGVRGQSLIFTLPGSINGVTEYLTEILPMLDHLFAMIHDLDTH